MSILSKIWSVGESLLASDLNATFNSLLKKTYTASGNIEINDAVYVSANDTVKSFLPTAVETSLSITTSTTSTYANKSMPLSTSGKFLWVCGGDETQARNLVAQVRTINATETDFSNGTELVIYNTSNGVNIFDICSIDVDKFLLIYQTNTGGVGAGIKAIVLTVSGTTVTAGTQVSIETTGNISRGVGCCKLDTNKGLILYTKDADGDQYAMVVTVATTTITQYTAVVVRVTGNNSMRVSVDQVTTNKAICVYGDASSSLYSNIIDVSSTTPTVQAVQTLVASSQQYKMKVRVISSTKALLAYGEGGTPVNDQLAILTISGSTITKGTNLAIGSANVTTYYGMLILSQQKAFVANYVSNTQYTLRYIDISGATPTQTSSEVINQTTTSNLNQGPAIVKVGPFLYVSTGAGATDADKIINMTLPAGNIGVAETAITNTASGNIINRFQLSDNFSTLTAGTQYYIDDNAQPTAKTSLRSKTYGIAISASKMLIQ